LARAEVFTTRRGARDSTSKVCVVLTTTPSFNETDTVREAERLRASGVSVIGQRRNRSPSNPGRI